MIALVNAHSISIPLADNSVHMVATSPPYWGLRDYGLPPLVWDAEPECRHQWGDEIIQHQRGQVGDHSTLDGGLQAGGDGRVQEARQGQFCQRCGAWRGCLGLEPSPDLYVAHMVQVFREIKRVLREDGSCWVNLGDAHSKGGGKQVLQTKNASHGLEGLRGQTPGLPSKQLLMIPSRVALALQADGWWVRSEIIWHKPNVMPESVTDRPTTAHEKVFLLSKAARYYYDQEAIREDSFNLDSRPRPFGGMSENRKNQDRRDYMYEGDSRSRNRRTVWSIPTSPYAGAHFATFPPALVEPMIKAGTSERGVCPECGGPWERVVEAGNVIPCGHGASKKQAKSYDEMPISGGNVGVFRTGTTREKITTGWRPTCACTISGAREALGIDDIPDEVTPAPIPAIVLDPFVGSGTTLLESRRLGRSGIGLDLSYDYLANQARKRLGLVALDEWYQGKNGQGESLETLPLFAEAAP